MYGKLITAIACGLAGTVLIPAATRKWEQLADKLRELEDRRSVSVPSPRDYKVVAGEGKNATYPDLEREFTGHAEACFYAVDVSRAHPFKWVSIMRRVWGGEDDDEWEEIYSSEADFEANDDEDDVEDEE